MRSPTNGTSVNIRDPKACIKPSSQPVYCYQRRTVLRPDAFGSYREFLIQPFFADARSICATAQLVQASRDVALNQGCT